MLFSIIGPPCSGKTTTAARAFADLKDAGFPAEFIPEQARVHIATRRAHEKGRKVELGDDDQFAILVAQAGLESVFAASNPSSTVVTDCAAFLALAYMTPESRARALQRAQESAARFTLVFRCSPVQPGMVQDPNRLHSFDESLALDVEIDAVLAMVGLPPERVVRLSGATWQRVDEIKCRIMEAVASWRPASS